LPGWLINHRHPQFNRKQRPEAILLLIEDDQQSTVELILDVYPKIFETSFYTQVAKLQYYLGPLTLRSCLC
jgi:hypothetical protein